MIIADFSPPLSDELLRKYNFFELYPFDGGGYFIQMEILNTIDDNEIFERIKNGALSDFGMPPEIENRRFERWKTIEKSCWINRYYFIVPLARKYWLAKDESIAVLVKETILNFIRNNKAPQGISETGAHIKRVSLNRDNNYNSRSFAEYSADESDTEYVWFDFQPASRIIHFLYSMYFLKDSPSVSPDEWKEMENSIRAHAELIMIGEKYFSELRESDNHQTIRGVALLFAASFFQGTEIASELLSEGIRIMSFHTLNDYFNDGVLKEISPSYHFFETWHVRDAYLLSLKYSFELPEETSGILKKAGLFAEAITQPDCKSAVINDGYALKLNAFIASLPDKSGTTETHQELLRFPDAGLAVFRKNGAYLLFDFSRFTGSFSHYHGGKNSFTYWHENRPFFIDSGCCDYDNPLFAKWFKTPEAHSSLLIGDRGDAVLKGTYEWLHFPEIKAGPWKKKDGEWNISATLASSVPEWKNIKWKRTISISGDERLSVSDIVTVKSPKRLTFNYILHPDVSLEIRGGKIMLSNGDVKLNIFFRSEKKPFIESVPCKTCIGGDIKDSFSISASLTADVGDNRFITLIN